MPNFPKDPIGQLFESLNTAGQLKINKQGGVVIEHSVTWVHRLISLFEDNPSLTPEAMKESLAIIIQSQSDSSEQGVLGEESEFDNSQLLINFLVDVAWSNAKKTLKT